MFSQTFHLITDFQTEEPELKEFREISNLILKKSQIYSPESEKRVVNNWLYEARMGVVGIPITWPM